MPGEIIIKQGTKYDSMFIMVSGCAGVYIADTHDSQGEPYEAGPVSKVGTLAEGSISGELSMLGVSSVRCATVQAEKICCMWEIHHDSAVSIINRMPDVRQQFAQIVIQHLQSAIPNLIDTLPLFRNFDRKFRMLLGLYCDPCAYFSGQHIFSEGQQGRGLCIINSGRAMLERKSITLKTYSPGMHFNSTIMLGVHQNSFCSLVAFKTCHVAFISRSSYLQALDSYPSHNAAAQLLRTECAEHEDFKKQIHRLCLRTRSWKKAMMMLHEDSIQSGQDADHNSSSLYAKLSSCPGLAHKPFSSVFSHSDTENARNEDCEEILKTQALTSWIKYVQQRKLQRSTSEKRKVINAEWVAKKKDAIARRKHKDDERERAVAFKPERKRRTGAKQVCASRPSSKETASRPTTKEGLLPHQARPVTAPSALTACVSTQPAGLDEGLPPLVSSPPPLHLIPTDLTLVKKHMAPERKISTDLTSLKKSVVLSEDSKFSAKSSSILEERWNETSSIYIKWRAKKPANYFKLSRR
jgi:CRP-like cAMP-binding protein